MVYFYGFNDAINFFYQIMKQINALLIQINNTSIFAVEFKYYITFPIVGIILTAIGSPRGKKGRIIGKILYFIVGYSIGFLLDCISTIVF